MQDEPFRDRAFAEPRPSLRSGQAFSARTTGKDLPAALGYELNLAKVFS